MGNLAAKRNSVNPIIRFLLKQQNISKNKKGTHGGVFVFFAMDNFAWFVISILVGAVISCAGIVALKQMAATKKAVEEDAAKAAPVAA